MRVMESSLRVWNVNDIVLMLLGAGMLARSRFYLNSSGDVADREGLPQNRDFFPLSSALRKHSHFWSICLAFGCASAPPSLSESTRFDN